VALHKVTLTTSGRHLVELDASQYMAVIPGDTMGIGISSSPVPISSSQSYVAGAWPTYATTYMAQFTIGEQLTFETVTVPNYSRYYPIRMRIGRKYFN